MRLPGLFSWAAPGSTAPMSHVPHYRTIILFCAAAIAGYAAFSVWAVLMSNDAALRGDVGGTWKSFCVAAFGFWLGSSSGGKAKDHPDPPHKPGEPPSSTP